MEPLKAKDADRILSEHLGAKLVAEGFEAVIARKWVRSTRAPIREVFQINAMKGASFAPAWGISLDFVPHLSGASIKTHRTTKGAVFDLSYDPVDYATDVNSWCADTFQAASEFAVAVDRVAEKALPLAKSFWAETATIDGLLKAFEAKRTRPFVRFGLDNYPQQSLAFAFVLARAGKLEEARERLHQLALPEGCAEALLARLNNPE